MKILILKYFNSRVLHLIFQLCGLHLKTGKNYFLLRMDFVNYWTSRLNKSRYVYFIHNIYQCKIKAIFIIIYLRNEVKSLFTYHSSIGYPHFHTIPFTTYEQFQYCVSGKPLRCNCSPTKTALVVQQAEIRFTMA